MRQWCDNIAAAGRHHPRDLDGTRERKLLDRSRAPGALVLVTSIAAWVVPVSNLAGVARHVIDVSRVGLPGWRLVVLAPEGPLLDALRAQGQAVQAVNIGEGVPTADAVRELRTSLKALRPTVVHSHLARADILSALATPGLGARLVSTEHHISPDPLMFHASRPRALAMQTVHHLRIRRFAALLAVSESTRRDMLRYWRPHLPVTVVRNGVDRPDAPVVRQPGLRLLSLTRLSPEKNLDMTLRAFALVRAERPTATLTIAGSGPELDRLRALAALLGVADAVAFPGFVDPVAAMASHDVIVQPSRSDNLSYTLLDAVVAGMGVAASPIGGNPEILPPHCIAPLDDDARLAAIAIEQGLDVAKRPTLPGTIPTVREMADQIVAAYSPGDRVKGWRRGVS